MHCAGSSSVGFSLTNPLDDFIDARDLIDWVSRTRSLEGSSDLLFEFSTYWEDIYLENIQTEKGTEKE